MGPLNIKTLVIPAGSAVSTEAIKLNHGEVVIGIIMPTSWTDSLIGFQSTTDGTDFRNVKISAYGGPYDLVKVSVDPGSWVVIDPVLTPGLRWFRIRSMDALGNNVNQAAEREVRIVAARVP